MDDVLRLQDDTNWFADWDVDIVIDLIIVSSLKFAVWAGVEDFPVELFAGDLNDLVGFRDGEFDFFPERLTCQSEPNKDQGGNDGPHQLQAGAAMGVYCPAVVIPAILVQEDDHERGDQNESRRRDVVDKIEERINACPVWGYVFRKPS